MIEALKGRARGYGIYWSAHRAFYGVRELVEQRIPGSGVQEWLWSRRAPASDEQLDLDLTHPHRRVLLEHLLADRADSYLEFGTGPGLNLELLARVRPDLSLIGVDISPQALAVAKRRLSRINEGTRVRLLRGSVSTLEGLSARSVDTVFSDAVLMYLAPDHLLTFVREAVRVARRRLVFLEWHLDTAESAAPFHYADGHWVHDFRRVVTKAIGRPVEIEPLPEGTWNGRGWSSYGATVTVALQP